MRRTPVSSTGLSGGATRSTASAASSAASFASSAASAAFSAAAPTSGSLVMGGLYELGQHAADALGVQECDRGSQRAVPRTLVHQSDALLSQFGQRSRDVHYAVPDVVQPLTACGEELADRGVVVEGLEELHVRRTAAFIRDAKLRLPHALSFVRLP